ncbi:hypothetical protein HDE69_002015 [Pedobacter cryoconitis]|uniref:Reverse transcriptase domain-containing protein n=1 Tax=Pedobacter cryoconitis TaxID=188932 RepID=A0A7W9DJ96_9SPHI|nr:reverse transcriptase domain-containing protein [Pedobacter cryoconitis]MBB5620962.1 hypothetical protein [Pedobacter cryoconitis]
MKNPLHQVLQDFLNTPEQQKKWLKSRGYLHITPKINVNARKTEMVSKVQNNDWVKRHAFFPLIHSVIKERKFKKHPDDPTKRGHSHVVKGKHKPSAKQRPLHYSTHIDSMIFGYYASYLLQLYELELEKHEGLKECITAYRKIGLDDDEETGKSTINFANEAFDEIGRRALNGCVVLMFDIESFFSRLNHEKLKNAWSKLLGDETRMPDDHFNVFKAATKFNYILRDDLRIGKRLNGRRQGFDERKLAKIRKFKGLEAFYESLEDFRRAIKSKEITVYKKQFVKDGVQVGIPQGLPISAVLANLYLLDFDLEVLNVVVKQMNGFYRRYSDDILIVCKADQANWISDFIETEIEKSRVSISTTKTETYEFSKIAVSHKKTKIVSTQILKSKRLVGKPLSYLGFEFYGEKILIKSANLAKFYRRIIYTVKRRAQRAIKIAAINSSTPVIYKAKLFKLYKRLDLDDVKEEPFVIKRLKRNPNGEFSFKKIEIKPKEEKPKKANYISYVRRSSRLMAQEEINQQVRKRRHIFNQALTKHLKKGLDN